MSIVTADSHVTLHYRLSMPDGQVVLNTFDDKPATLQLGSGQFSPGLERCLVALQEGDERSYVLGPDDAFGPRNPSLIQKVSRKLLAEHADPSDPLEPGDLLEFPSPDGGRFAGVFKGWEGDAALFDFNHPLAGQALTFHVRIIGVLSNASSIA
jgi:FKBP-type peptidyl-prolyl cis-trans isomerase SlpA